MATYIGQNLYIRPNYIVSLPEYIDTSNYKSKAYIENINNLDNNNHKGKLSTKALNKLKNAINWLILSAKDKSVYSTKTKSWFKFKINFVTLTLPDTTKEITDKIFKEELLNPYLTYLRKYHGLKNYVWKLEFQKNGKLHIHITTDSFIHHKEIKRIWNMQLQTKGYLEDFYQKFNHRDPNSTDIHSVNKIKNLAGYLAKYMSKNSEDLIKIKGRIWGCSYELSRANKTTLFVDRDECHEVITPLMNTKIDYQSITTLDKYTNEPRNLGEIFFIKPINWINDIKGKIKDKFIEAIEQIRNLTTDSQIKAQMQLYQV
jgi:hypothetical protein